MRDPEIVFDSDKTFRRILSLLLGLYFLTIVLAQGIKGPKAPPIAPIPHDAPPRVARLLMTPQKTPPAPPIPKAPPKVEAPPKPLPPPTSPKVEKAEKIEKAAPPPKERVKKVGLLGLLGGKSAGPPPLGGGFSPLKEIPKEAPSPSGKERPSFAQEEIEKIRQRALVDHEKKLTETRKAVIEEDLSRTQITQGGSDRTQEGISEVVRRNREKLLAVYNKMLQGNPNLQGNVTIEFVISAQGEVLQCHVLTSSFASPPFEQALVQEILRWKFPPVQAGSTTVLYPLSFSPAD